jgi:NADH-quinone oxidoreductase subunit L
MMYLTFYGKFRGTHDQEHHLHESPPTILVPLIILAVLSIVGGFIGVPEVMGGHHELEQFLAPVFEKSTKILGEHHMSASLEWGLMGASVALALAAMLYAYVKYAKNGSVPVADTEERPALTSLSYHKFYLDELYDLIVRKPLDWLSNFFYNIIERLGIDGLVNGIGKGTIETSKGLRLLQTGNVGFYIFIMVLGVIAVLLYSVFGLTKI